MLANAPKSAIFFKSLLVIAGLVMGQLTSAAQTAQPSAGPAAKFEIVSIHPHDPHSSAMVQAKFTADSFTATNFSVIDLFLRAYPAATDLNRISGWPEWAQSARFDIQAKMNDEDAAAYQKLSGTQLADRQHALLQSLLTERFGLKMHRDVQQRAAYALTVAKGGPKLTPAAKSDAPAHSGMRFGASLAIIGARSSTLDELLPYLNHATHRPVVDKTGIAGKFDMEIKFTPDEMQNAPDPGPSIFTALQEQLGLKLEATKAPIDVFIVDQVEKPAAD